MSKHIANNINKAKHQLAKIQRFGGLSINNRRKLYLMLVRSTLLYPCIPLHITSNDQMMKMQKTQNKGINFILQRGRPKEETTEERHRLSQLEPVNMILHRKAQDIWKSIYDNIHEETIQDLEPTDHDTRIRNYRNFPSSQDARQFQALPFYTLTCQRWQ